MRKVGTRKLWLILWRYGRRCKIPVKNDPTTVHNLMKWDVVVDDMWDQVVKLVLSSGGSLFLTLEHHSLKKATTIEGFTHSSQQLCVTMFKCIHQNIVTFNLGRFKCCRQRRRYATKGYFLTSFCVAVCRCHRIFFFVNSNKRRSITQKKY